MIYSGLDWSGSPGEAHGPLVAFAIVHIDQSEAAALDTALAVTRQALRLPSSYVFAHNGSSARTRDAFFAALQRTSLTSHVLIVRKADWAAQQVEKPTGAKFLRDAIVSLILRCPDAVVARQVLYIDLPAREIAVAGYQTAIRDALRAGRPRRTGFKDVRPCADHRLHGGIIQAADMIAGEARDHGGLAGSSLPRLGRRVVLV